MLQGESIDTEQYERKVGMKGMVKVHMMEGMKDGQGAEDGRDEGDGQGAYDGRDEKMVKVQRMEGMKGTVKVHMMEGMKRWSRCIGWKG
jgi:hypothetical protein